VGIEVEGYYAGATPVVFGNEGIYLLGSVTMEELGPAPDSVKERLKSTEVLLMWQLNAALERWRCNLL